MLAPSDNPSAVEPPDLLTSYPPITLTLATFSLSPMKLSVFPALLRPCAIIAAPFACW